MVGGTGYRREIAYVVAVSPGVVQIIKDRVQPDVGGDYVDTIHIKEPVARVAGQIRITDDVDAEGVRNVANSDIATISTAAARCLLLTIGRGSSRRRGDRPSKRLSRR